MGGGWGESSNDLSRPAIILFVFKARVFSTSIDFHFVGPLIHRTIEFGKKKYSIAAAVVRQLKKEKEQKRRGQIYHSSYENFIDSNYAIRRNFHIFHAGSVWQNEMENDFNFYIFSLHLLVEKGLQKNESCRLL